MIPEFRLLIDSAIADQRQRGEATTLPAWIKPQLTKLVDEPPEGVAWLHEIKFEGYRMHAPPDRGAVRLLTRTGLDRTHKYRGIAEAVASLPARQTYLDGELCGVRPDGTTSFSLIQNASDTGNGAALVFFLFDLLHLDGERVSARPLRERKERLRVLLSEAPSPLQFSDHQIGRVRGLLRAGLRVEAGGDYLKAGRCALHARQSWPVAESEMPEPREFVVVGWTA
jgi:bifunctional non-homologous end joining protein LigD